MDEVKVDGAEGKVPQALVEYRAIVSLREDDGMDVGDKLIIYSLGKPEIVKANVEIEQVPPLISPF